MPPDRVDRMKQNIRLSALNLSIRIWRCSTWNVNKAQVPIYNSNPGSYPRMEIQLGGILQTQTHSTCERQALLFWISGNSLRVSGRPGLILATGIASESEVRWTEECTSSFHLNPSSCRNSCFLYVRAFLASINLRCASEFGLHWRNRIIIVVIDGLPTERERENICIIR